MAWFGSSSRTRPLIVHIDDSQTVLAVTKLMLESLGYDVIQATSGAEGIKLAEKEKPTLILLDAMMPGIDGFETCVSIKRNPKLQGVPVIMATGADAVKDVEKAMACGADSYIVKPLQQDRLKTKLEGFIKPKPSQAA